MATGRGQGVSLDAVLRKVAREHSEVCRAEVVFVPGEGWLCSRCDEDYVDYPWEGSPEKFN